jgi:lipoprotein-anchoring transpeptidase ErfK/SrfK
MISGGLVSLDTEADSPRAPPAAGTMAEVVTWSLQPFSGAIRRRWAVCAASVLVFAGICLAGAPNASAAVLCHRGGATASVVGRPTRREAWRAEILGSTGVYGGVSRVGTRARSFVGPAQASWLLVLDAARTNSGRCWVEVRLPWRPNGASGWVRASQVTLRPTPWRIVVSTGARSLSVYRRGRRVRRVPVVVGKPGTPTPVGLFSIVGAWPDPPTAFLGSWILPLTAHSDVLQQFDGGDGTVGIHGRGGASLLDPLGSASSHGCIRVDNSSIDWLVATIGVGALPGIPVRVE